MARTNYLKTNFSFAPHARNICPGRLSNELCKVLGLDNYGKQATTTVFTETLVHAPIITFNDY